MTEIDDKHLQQASIFIAAGALILFLTAIMLSFVFGACMVDLGLLIVAWIQWSLRRGSVRAATWTLVLLGLYGVTCVLLLVGLSFSLSGMRLNGHPLPVSVTAPLMLAVGCVLLWATIGFVLAIRARRVAIGLQRIRDGKCANCGYDVLRTNTLRCPECGRPRAPQ